MMTYTEFNERILEFYIFRSVSGHCILALDTAELKTIIDPTELTGFTNLRYEWDGLLAEVNGVPQYFGLIAIQCFAASLMEREEHVTASAYQLRLIRLLGIADENELQNLFRGKTTPQPIQEIIWQSAKYYFRTRLSQHLEIPDATVYAGRYVQYPKSQGLLNTEELKRFTGFFNTEFRIGERLEFNYFKTRLNSAFKNIPLTYRIREIFQEQLRAQLCYRQVYNFYHSWDGEVIEFNTGKAVLKRSTIKKDVKTRQLILIKATDKAEFYFSDTMTAVEHHKLMTLNGYKYYYRDLIIFSAMSYYQDEYEESRHLYSGINSYILLCSQKNQAVSNYLLAHGCDKQQLSEQLMLFNYLPGDYTLTSPLRTYYQANAPGRLTGGIKLSRQQAYIEGFGPSVSSDFPYVIIHQNNRYDYSPARSPAGTYHVRIDNYRDITFTIVPVRSEKTVIVPRDLGWELSSYQFKPAPQLEGCLLRLPEEQSKEVREWIKLLTKPNSKKHFSSSNILLSAINNSML